MCYAIDKTLLFRESLLLLTRRTVRLTAGGNLIITETEFPLLFKRLLDWLVFLNRGWHNLVTWRVHFHASAFRGTQKPNTSHRLGTISLLCLMVKLFEAALQSGCRVCCVRYTVSLLYLEPLKLKILALGTRVKPCNCAPPIKTFLVRVIDKHRAYIYCQDCIHSDCLCVCLIKI
jgi:hypothetical protein